MAHCPCGCGQKVGFTKKGSAKIYPEAVEAAFFYREARNSTWLAEEADPALRQRVLAAASSAEQMPVVLLEHLHGTAGAGTPDLMTLAQQFRANRALAEEIGTRYG